MVRAGLPLSVGRIPGGPESLSWDPAGILQPLCLRRGCGGGGPVLPSAGQMSRLAQQPPGPWATHHAVPEAQGKGGGILEWPLPLEEKQIRTPACLQGGGGSAVHFGALPADGVGLTSPGSLPATAPSGAHCLGPGLRGEGPQEHGKHLAALIIMGVSMLSGSAAGAGDREGVRCGLSRRGQGRYYSPPLRPVKVTEVLKGHSDANRQEPGALREGWSQTQGAEVSEASEGPC